VGNDALIARGSFVNFDVPPSAVVLGNPGKIDSESAGYINSVPDAE
jgi:serine O-acetyltransferase